jgi:uncharacterized protein YnzC (UPF0291/DUF896 family)
MNRIQLLFCLFFINLYKSNLTTEDFDKFFNINLLKKKFESEKRNLLANAKKAKPLTKEEKENKIKNYRKYLKDLKERKYNTPEKSIIFNLTQEFLAKSIQARRLKIEERNFKTKIN